MGTRFPEVAMQGQTSRRLAAATGALAALLACGSAWAQVAGEVEFARGVGFVQTPGQQPRTLGKGLPLREGDRITTSEGASAIVKLEDGTRMTVRPNSEIVLTQYQFRENAPESNGMLLQMVRGGFRAITGLISKSSPNAAKVQTSTATIGIRGTDFDARICQTDCGRESAQVADASRPNAVLATAKLVQVQGVVNAVGASSQRRRLVDGGSIYPGDVIETAPGARAVLAFRDESRITVGSNTRFRVDNFVFDEQNASEGRFLVSLLRGTARVLTGLVAKANTRNVGFSTATATIGVRGTLFDITCEGECESPEAAPGQPGAPSPNRPVAQLAMDATGAGDSDTPVRAGNGGWGDAFTIAQAGTPGGGGSNGLTLYVHDGSVDFRLVLPPSAPSGVPPVINVLQAGQGAAIGRGGIVPLATPPVIDAPRPDTVPAPPKLFSRESVSDTREGLFVFVRDGHIEVSPNGGEPLHLGRGEAGFAGLDGFTARPTIIPKFIEFDRLPLPTARNPLLASVLSDNNLRPKNSCN
jgi:hypothetical protein